MAKTINGEQPFSVASDIFALSPSAEGYTLQYSVDGITFTDWDEETIPAGENVVIRAKRGLIYKLLGNQSEIKVNE